MSEEREFEGKNLEEALDQAASSMGVDQDALDYEMVEQGRRGLLGLGVKAVRIRVKPPIDVELPAETLDVDLEPAPEREPRPRQRSGNTKKKSKSRSRPRQRSRPKTEERDVSPAPPEQAKAVEETVQRMVELIGLDLEIPTLASAREAATDLPKVDLPELRWEPQAVQFEHMYRDAGNQPSLDWIRESRR